MNKLFKYLLVVMVSFSLVACGSSAPSNGNSDAVAASQFEKDVLFGQSSVGVPVSSEATCEPDEFEQELLDAINVVRSVARLCGSRQFLAAEPVAWSCQLESAANVHAVDMSRNNFFSHTGSDGLRISTRADDAGYEWSKVGENIAAGYPGVDLVIDAWLDSPSHCVTLMDDDYQDVGVAVEFPETADYEVYWTLVMGQPMN
jgi:uncharacterized protein YkwD